MTAEKRAEAIKEWRHIVKEIMNIMRKAFNQEQKEKYLTSVMEQVSVFGASLADNAPAEAY